MGIKGIRTLYEIRDEWNFSKGEELSMSDEKLNYDDEDVKAALERETADGSGFGPDGDADLPPSDFEGFPEEFVENDADGEDNAGDDGVDSK